MARTMRDGDVKYWETESIDEHVGLIQRQVTRSLDDPELPSLVRAIIENDPGPRGTLHAWGATFAAPRDRVRGPVTDEIKLVRIWNFVSRNWSYIEDPPGFDLFAHIKYGMNARAHAARLKETLTSVKSPETRRMIVDHVRRLEDVDTAGAGDCDDGVIVFASLLKTAGFKRVRGRVVSVDAKAYGHIYTMVGMPATRSTHLLALDPTVKGATPGWEYPKSKVVVDFEL